MEMWYSFSDVGVQPIKKDKSNTNNPMDET